jgi:hypothetical protein
MFNVSWQLSIPVEAKQEAGRRVGLAPRNWRFALKGTTADSNVASREWQENKMGRPSEERPR